MVKLTFLEVHLDGDLVANAPFGGTKTREDDDESNLDVRASDGESGTDRRSWIAAAVGLLFLAVLAAVANRKFRGGNDDTDLETTESGYDSEGAEVEVA